MFRHVIKLPPRTHVQKAGPGDGGVVVDGSAKRVYYPPHCQMLFFFFLVNGIGACLRYCVVSVGVESVREFCVVVQGARSKVRADLGLKSVALFARLDVWCEALEPVTGVSGG